jgi:hypothetical protein
VVPGTDVPSASFTTTDVNRPAATLTVTGASGRTFVSPAAGSNVKAAGATVAVAELPA